MSTPPPGRELIVDLTETSDAEEETYVCQTLSSRTRLSQALNERISCGPEVVPVTRPSVNRLTFRRDADLFASGCSSYPSFHSSSPYSSSGSPSPTGGMGGTRFSRRPYKYYNQASDKTLSSLAGDYLAGDYLQDVGAFSVSRCPKIYSRQKRSVKGVTSLSDFSAAGFSQNSRMAFGSGVRRIHSFQPHKRREDIKLEEKPPHNSLMEGNESNSMARLSTYRFDNVYSGVHAPSNPQEGYAAGSTKATTVDFNNTVRGPDISQVCTSLTKPGLNKTNDENICCNRSKSLSGTVSLGTEFSREPSTIRQNGNIENSWINPVHVNKNAFPPLDSHAKQEKNETDHLPSNWFSDTTISSSITNNSKDRSFRSLPNSPNRSLLSSLPMPCSSLTRNLELPSSSFTNLINLPRLEDPLSPTLLKSPSFEGKIYKVMSSPGAFMEEDPEPNVKSTIVFDKVAPAKIVGTLKKSNVKEGPNLSIEIICVSSDESEDDKVRKSHNNIASLENSVVVKQALSQADITNFSEISIISKAEPEKSCVSCLRKVNNLKFDVSDQNITEEKSESLSEGKEKYDFEATLYCSIEGETELSLEKFQKDAKNNLKDNFYQPSNSKNLQESIGGLESVVKNSQPEKNTGHFKKYNGCIQIKPKSDLSLKFNKLTEPQLKPKIDGIEPHKGNKDLEPFINPMLTTRTRKRRLTSLSGYAKIQETIVKRRGRPPGTGRGLEKGIGPKKRPFLQYAKQLWSADNRRRVELENPNMTCAEVEKKLDSDFDKLDVKDILKEVKRAKSVVGPEVKALEAERIKSEKEAKKNRKVYRRPRTKGDVKLGGRVKRSLIALFISGMVDNKTSVKEKWKKFDIKALSRRRQRDSELAEMRKLLKASIPNKTLPLKMLNSAYNQLSDFGKRSLLGVYLIKMSDAFARDEYKKFVDAFRFIFREVNPCSVQDDKKSIHDIWKSIGGKKLDFLKSKLEIVFPKVLGKSVRKSPVASEATRISESSIFKESVRLMDSSDTKVIESVIELNIDEFEDDSRLINESQAKKSTIILRSPSKFDNAYKISFSKSRSAVYKRNILDILEETVEVEEDFIDLSNKDKYEEDLEPNNSEDKELAPLPESGDFPLPLSSSSRTDLIENIVKLNQEDSLTPFSGLTDISPPFHGNLSDLSIGNAMENIPEPKNYVNEFSHISTFGNSNVMIKKREREKPGKVVDPCKYSVVYSRRERNNLLSAHNFKTDGFVKNDVKNIQPQLRAVNNFTADNKSCMEICPVTNSPLTCTIRDISFPERDSLHRLSTVSTPEKIRGVEDSFEEDGNLSNCDFEDIRNNMVQDLDVTNGGEVNFSFEEKCGSDKSNNEVLYENLHEESMPSFGLDYNGDEPYLKRSFLFFLNTVYDTVNNKSILETSCGANCYLSGEQSQCCDVKCSDNKLTFLVEDIPDILNMELEMSLLIEASSTNLVVLDGNDVQNFFDHFALN